MKIKNIIAFVTVAAISGTIGYNVNNKPVYSDLMQAVEKQDNIVTLVNSEGESFTYEEEFTLYLGEYYNVTFRDAGKRGSIYDDEIVSVTYEAIDLF